ncbi:MAG: M17 family peptidase N-terminal domain-containing protein [Myxococcota bacterium]
MQVSAHSGDVAVVTTDLLVIGVFDDAVTQNPHVKVFDRALDGNLKTAAKDADFKGESKQSLVLHTLGKLRAKRIALQGLGSQKTLKAAQWVEWGANATRMGNQVSARSIVLVLPQVDDVQAVTAW